MTWTESDAGRGLRWHGYWLVSTPSAARARWLAPWCQLVLSEVWNASVLALRAAGWSYRNRRWLLVRRDTRRALACAWAGFVPLVVIGTGTVLAALGRMG